jgi:hypothetical protein
MGEVYGGKTQSVMLIWTCPHTSYTLNMKDMKITKKVWIITDKKRGLIAKGIPRFRYMELINNDKDNKRVLTYSTKKKAEQGFIDVWFYHGTDVNEYCLKTYGIDWWDEKIHDYIEAVEAEFIINI